MIFIIGIVIAMCTVIATILVIISSIIIVVIMARRVIMIFQATLTSIQTRTIFYYLGV